jgi:minor extracellular serine protease Vpr
MICPFGRGWAVLLGIVLSFNGFALDRVRTEAQVNEALERYGVTGKGVLVAVLDRGIDWRNADFRDAAGKTRIEYIYDLMDPAGASAPGNFQGKGTVYTRAQIQAALDGGAGLATRDAVGHGTTTASIAAGGGRNYALYRGIAPESRLLVVKLVSDGAPAHGAQAAEAPFYDPALIPVAIDFVVAKAKELGMPAVMLLNIGSVGGSTDGTSRLARKIDSVVGPGKPGLVFVTGASDDGSAANRAGGVVKSGETVTLEIRKEDAGTLTFDLWYAETDRLDVTVTTPTATYGPYVAPSGPTRSDIHTESEFLYYHLGRDMDFDTSTNQRRELWMRLSGPAGLYRVQLTGRVVVDGRFDATLNPSRFNAADRPINRFLNFVMPGSIWDLASASNNICPNSYVIRTNYNDIDGVRRVLREGAVGELWKGSGVGPTFDGRLGIDVSAPGDSLITAYAPLSHWATARFNTVASPAGLYGRASAVSAANPIVTGIIALLLEMDPTLDAAQVKVLLQKGARADAFTGAVPNPNWGYGKVNALKSVELLHSEMVRMTVERSGEDRLRIRSRGHRGGAYVLQGSVDLEQWQGVLTNRAEPNLDFELPAGDGMRFLRLVRRPDL